MWAGLILVRSEAIYPSPVFIISSFPFTLRGAPRAKITRWLHQMARDGQTGQQQPGINAPSGFYPKQQQAYQVIS